MTESLIADRQSHIDRWLIVVILLLAWGLRLCCLETIPPGWRDDELVEIYTLSGEVLAGRPAFYFTGASGHEPLYHTVRAGLLALWGINPLTGHLIPIVSGTLAVSLTHRLCRRLFGRTVALLAAALMACGFWPLMYSRFGVRHQMLVPLALAMFCLLWSVARSASASRRRAVVASGVSLAAALYTYTASRVMPLILLGFGIYLALFHRQRFRRWWQPLLAILLLAAALTAPMWVAIARGRSEAAAQGVGADARLAELAVPLRELQAGNPRPLLENVWTTLGMFHATGDPEWLYNIAGRPVFNLLGGVLLWAGVVLCLFRWRQPRCSFLLLWMGCGLLPTFLSIPAASLSHSILAQPVAYILPILPLVETYRWLKSQLPNLKPRIRSLPFAICCLLSAVFLATNAIRDLHDYFVVWPREEMVRILYRADYREAARYLDAHPEIADIAVSSALFGPWDRLALETDTWREDVAVRLFDPGRVMVWSSGDDPSTVLLTSWPHPASPIDGSLETSVDPPEIISPRLTLYNLPAVLSSQSQIPSPLARFANGLELIGARWVDEPLPGQESVLLTAWLVAAPLDLPPMPIVANPPPLGVYSGPRLKVFAHLPAADGTFGGGDDGLWVDPLTLQPGDYFVQVHRFELPTDAPAGPYTVRLGLYDPKTGGRWAVLGDAGQPVSDHVLVLVGED
jgi:4-amino-4-deoxy-L-arabinose transferase-like glycosyltransferase